MSLLSKLTPSQCFLIDGIGAVVSALLLGVVLVHYQQLIGLPEQVLYWLAGLATLFAVYSLTCYWRTPANWQPYLSFIAVVNLLYCCLTVVLVFLHESISPLGGAYFVVEIIIVVTIALLELKKTRMTG